MKYDVIVIAGTTEAREVIERQLKQKKTVLASVATELGAQMLTNYSIDVHIGRLDEAGFVRLFEENSCEKIIDASHPFAQLVSETVQKAAKTVGVPYERYERSCLHYDYERIIPVANANEAAKYLNQIEGNVLLTTGVNTAAVYAKHVKNARQRLYIRVLDTLASYEGCAKAGYPQDHVFGEMPPYTVEDNLALIEKTGAAVLVSKDSGKTGGVDIKVEACRRAGIDCILIRRPGQE